MPNCQTKFHGEIAFDPDHVLKVPRGLFGFPEETEFLLLELESSRPIVFIQSIHSTNLCFISLPVQVIQADYKLNIHSRDLEEFGYSEQKTPAMGKDLLCLALLTIGERQATTANLAAPMIIDISAHRGMQVIVDGDYAHRYPFLASRLGQSAN